MTSGVTTSATPSGPGVLAVLRGAVANPGLRRLLAGSAAWMSADAAFFVALTVEVFHEGGTGAVAVLAVARALPSVFILPVVTSLVDRVLLGTQLRAVLAIRVATVLAAAIILATGGSVVLLIVLSAIDALAGTLLRPIRSSFVPALARSPEELIAANLGITSGDSLAALIGPALAGLILVVAGAEITVIAATVLVGLGLVLVAALHDDTAPSTGTADPGDAPGAEPHHPQRPHWLEGFRDIVRLPAARLIITLFVAQRFVRGAIPVLVVATAIDLVGMGEPGVGWLNAAIGFGGLIGGIASLGLVSRWRLGPAFIAGIVAWGAGVALPGLLPLAIVALVALAVAGAGKVVLDISGFSLLQRAVPTEARGRVLGALEGLVAGSLSLGSVAAAWLVAVAGPGWALVLIGAVPVVGALLAWLPMRSADAAAHAHERELRALRGVPLFRPLGLNALDRVAATVAWESIAAGSDVVRQGEAGDRFYLVESGSLDVTQDGRLLGALGPGGSFGEIALLHARPRTATVTAAEPSIVGAVEGGAFLAAVNGHPDSALAAEAQACDRLLADVG